MFPLMVSQTFAKGGPMTPIRSKAERGVAEEPVAATPGKAKDAGEGEATTAGKGAAEE